MKDTKDETLEEQDITLREVKQLHKIIDEMIVDITQENAEIGVILQTYFQQVIRLSSSQIFLKHFMKKNLIKKHKMKSIEKYSEMQWY